MATGDLKNNIKKLQSQIKAVKYTGKLDLDLIKDGSPTAFLPLYHYIFTSYSNKLNKDISNSNNELYGKSDLRFIEAVYKILRDMFSYKPPVNREQFFQPGFAERKVIMATEILRHVHCVYNPPSSGSSYKLASKIEKKQREIQTKVQTSIHNDHHVTAQTRPRKVAGKLGPDLTQAIVLPRYMTSSASSTSSHDWRESRLVGPHSSVSTDVSDTETLVSQSRSPPASSTVEEGNPTTVQFTQHITHALSMLNMQVGKISTALEKVETQIAANEGPRIQQPIQSPFTPDTLQRETLWSKVILLENRMTLLENKVEDIQTFCTILLENSNKNNNAVTSRPETITSLPPTVSDTNNEKGSSQEQEVHSSRIHPDYVLAFAAVADVGVKTTGDCKEKNVRIDDNYVDADDEITIEDVVARNDEAGGDWIGKTTGDMNFMKTLVGATDSETSLIPEQEDSRISIQEVVKKPNPNVRTMWTPSQLEGIKHFGENFSPIPDHKDTSLLPFDDNSLIHIPYAPDGNDLESRRLSSTPNKADLDSSTLSRVNRIMQMMKETQQQFNQNS